jgi:pimeloyl-ACP methyl ester carboxylesterase
MPSRWAADLALRSAAYSRSAFARTPPPSASSAANWRISGRTRRPAVSSARSVRYSNVPPTVWGYVSQLFAAAGWTSLLWLHRISASTLILTGGSDPIVPPINARILGARIPDATVEVVPRAGHLLPLDPGLRPCRARAS